MSISINLTEGELDLLLSSLNYLNEEQEVTLMHKHGSVQVIYDKLYFALKSVKVIIIQSLSLNLIDP